MTPQERQLVADLFERLAALENEPRDPDAEQAIREGLAKAPHAVYALVQSVLVQDEALKQADAHIRELEAALQGGPEASGQPKGFLDNMRDALFGHGEPHGSVPTVRPGDQPMGVPPQYRSSSGAAWGSGTLAGGGMPSGGGMPPGGGMQPMPQESYGRGGSFLGTAAAAAAGMIGGGLLLGGIRSMLGGQGHGPFAGTFDQVNPGGRSPWGGSEPGGDLARQAGLDDIGRGQGRSAGLLDSDDRDDRTAGLLDTAENEAGDDSDFDDEVDAGSDDTDNA